MIESRILRHAREATAMAAMGSQKLAVLLCKFSDTADVEQHPKSFYDDLFVGRERGAVLASTSTATIR